VPVLPDKISKKIVSLQGMLTVFFCKYITLSLNMIKQAPPPPPQAYTVYVRLAMGLERGWGQPCGQQEQLGLLYLTGHNRHASRRAPSCPNVATH